MPRYIFIFILCALTNLTGLNAQQDTSAYIFGTVRNAEIDYIQVEYIKNQLTGEKEAFQVVFEEDGTFLAPLDLSNAAIITLIYKRLHIPIFISQGMRLHMSFDAQMPLYTMTYRQEDGNYDNLALQDYVKEFGFMNDKNYNFYHPSLRVLSNLHGRLMRLGQTEMFEYINFYRKQEIAHFKGYNKLSDEFREYIDYFITYRWASYQVRFIHPFVLYGNDEKAYYANVSDSIVNNTDALYHPSYCTFLDEYLLWSMKMAQKKTPNYHKDWKTIYKYTVEQLPNISPKAKNFVLARLLYFTLNPRNAKDLESYVQDYMAREDIADFEYTVRKRFGLAKRFTTGSAAPDFSLVDINGDMVSLSQYKGKIVYLTFWAEWCDKCIIEMYESGKNRTALANEDIVFLYVGLDRKKTEWLNNIVLEDIDGKHLWGISSYSEVAKAYDIHSLPRYFFIDKNGEFITPTKKSSDKDFVQYVQKMLE